MPLGTIPLGTTAKKLSLIITKCRTPTRLISRYSSKLPIPITPSSLKPKMMGMTCFSPPPTKLQNSHTRLKPSTNPPTNSGLGSKFHLSRTPPTPLYICTTAMPMLPPNNPKPQFGVMGMQGFGISMTRQIQHHQQVQIMGQMLGQQRRQARLTGRQALMARVII